MTEMMNNLVIEGVKNNKSFEDVLGDILENVEIKIGEFKNTKQELQNSFDLNRDLKDRVLEGLSNDKLNAFDKDFIEVYKDKSGKIDLESMANDIFVMPQAKNIFSEKEINKKSKDNIER